jgi:UDP-3-O-[3-hydroxymyristoyl] glucosamine N-acyltransferase
MRRPHLAQKLSARRAALTIPGTVRITPNASAARTAASSGSSTVADYATLNDQVHLGSIVQCLAPKK